MNYGWSEAFAAYKVHFFTQTKQLAMTFHKARVSPKSYNWSGITRLSLFLTALSIALASPTHAQQNDAFWQDKERGERLLRRHCSRCHKVGLNDAVGVIGETPTTKAPMFKNLSRNLSIDSLADSLADGVLTGHLEMPTFYLTSSEVDAIIAYLKSIQMQ
jgi:cytochrome c